VGAREPEARDELARGETGQEVSLLLRSAVANEQFAGAETVGHRHCRVGITAFGAQLQLSGARMGVKGWWVS